MIPLYLDPSSSSNCLLALIIAIMVIVIALGLFVWLARRLSNSGTSDSSAVELLKRRYAGGEIDREEYERILADLQS